MKEPLYATATFSEDRTMRLMLERGIQEEGLTALWIGVNPSSAGADSEDPSTRKIAGFTKRFGGRRYLLGNVFPYIATDVKDLLVDDLAENRLYLRNMIEEADLIIPCWGNQSKVKSWHRVQFDVVIEMMKLSGKPIKCLGTTNSGDPKHPLYVPYETELVDWI